MNKWKDTEKLFCLGAVIICIGFIVGFVTVRFLGYQICTICLGFMALVIATIAEVKGPQIRLWWLKITWELRGKPTFKYKGYNCGICGAWINKEFEVPDYASVGEWGDTWDVCDKCKYQDGGIILRNYPSK